MFYFKTRKQVRDTAKLTGKTVIDNGVEAGSKRWAINYL